MIITNRDFVIVGQQPWDYPAGSNCINIAEEIAQHNRVLYVNPPVDWITMLRKRPEELYILERRKAILNQQRPQLEKVNEKLFVYSPIKPIASINMLPDGFIYDQLNRINNRRFANQISEAISKLSMKRIILFNDGDMLRSFYLKEFLKPSLSIYYSRDNFLAVDYWKKHGSRLEPELMAKSDLVVTNSVYLKNLAERFNQNSEYIGQGCDFSMFDPDKTEKIPDDLDSIAHPRIGYIGALLKLRLDINLLETLARQKPEWQIVLIGPVDEAFSASGLHQHKNVHFLGAKPMDQLAAYLKGFDLAINPQLLNEVTMGNYPRKIDEYLAMGLPTVATDTETMSAFSEFVYLCSNSEEYLQKIELALQEDSEAFGRKRREFALEHSWENNVLALYEAITKTMNQHGAQGQN